jgi:hypothetical protein
VIDEDQPECEAPKKIQPQFTNPGRRERKDAHCWRGEVRDGIHWVGKGWSGNWVGNRCHQPVTIRNTLNASPQRPYAAPEVEFDRRPKSIADAILFSQETANVYSWSEAEVEQRP